MAARTFRKKKQQQSRIFFGVIFLSTLTWITKKELEQVIEIKETNFVGRRTRKFKAAVRK